MATMMVRGERGQMAEKDGNVFDTEVEGGRACFSLGGQ